MADGEGLNGASALQRALEKVAGNLFIRAQFPRTNESAHDAALTPQGFNESRQQTDLVGQASELTRQLTATGGDSGNPEDAILGMAVLESRNQLTNEQAVALANARANRLKTNFNFLFFVKVPPYRESDGPREKLKESAPETKTFYEEYVKRFNVSSTYQSFEYEVDLRVKRSPAFGVNEETFKANVKPWQLQGIHASEWGNGAILRTIESMRAEDVQNELNRVGQRWPMVYTRVCLPDLMKNQTMADVLPAEIDQTENFKRIEPLIDEAIKGVCDVMIMAYGQTNSGKTYTVQGEGNKGSETIDEGDGLLPRIAQRIFQDQSKPVVSVKMFESNLMPSKVNVNAETITDLSDGAEKPMAQVVSRQIGQGHGSHFDQFAIMYDAATKRRKQSKTDQNDFSSRSHFTVEISLNEQSKIYVIDLAGSENSSSKLGFWIRDELKDGKSFNFRGKSITQYTSDEDLLDLSEELTASWITTKKNTNLNVNILAISERYDVSIGINASLERIFNTIQKFIGDPKIKTRKKGEMLGTDYGTNGKYVADQKALPFWNYLVDVWKSGKARTVVYMCLDSYDEKPAEETLKMIPTSKNHLETFKKM